MPIEGRWKFRPSGIAGLNETRHSSRIHCPLPTALCLLVIIYGGTPLNGRVEASGSKNAALPIMAASILADGPVTLERVPQLTDVDTLSEVLRRLGMSVERYDDRLCIETIDAQPVRADHRFVRRMRGSFCVLGPLVARRQRAVVSLPGGCAIGDRPVDLHLKGLAALGADVRFDSGYCVVAAKRLRGATIDLLGPQGPSVTATANILSAATLARGRTVILNAAREPEIVDLGRFLIALGARIEGLGTSTIEVVGVDSLGAAEHKLIPDRIEVATLLLAGVITRGNMTVERVIPAHLDAVLSVLAQAGVKIRSGINSVSVEVTQRFKPITIDARPYPGIPTDVQAQLMAVAALASGRSTIVDHVFPERFSHTAELRRLGARISRRGNVATIDGVPLMTGTTVVASDLRKRRAGVGGSCSPWTNKDPKRASSCTRLRRPRREAAPARCRNRTAWINQTRRARSCWRARREDLSDNCSRLRVYDVDSTFWND